MNITVYKLLKKMDSISAQQWGPRDIYTLYPSAWEHYEIVDSIVTNISKQDIIKRATSKIPAGADYADMLEEVYKQLYYEAKMLEELNFVLGEE